MWNLLSSLSIGSSSLPMEPTLPLPQQVVRPHASSSLVILGQPLFQIYSLHHCNSFLDFSGLFWTKGCAFYSLTSLPFLCIFQVGCSLLPSLCLPPPSIPQVSKEEGRERNICRAWMGKGKETEWDPVFRQRRERASVGNVHGKCPNPSLETVQIPGWHDQGKDTERSRQEVRQAMLASFPREIYVEIKATGTSFPGTQTFQHSLQPRTPESDKGSGPQ